MKAAVRTKLPNIAYRIRDGRISSTPSSSSSGNGVKVSRGRWPRCRTLRAAARSAAGSVNSARRRSCHAALSSCASCRVSNIDTVGITREMMRNRKANNPSGEIRNVQSQKLGWKTLQSDGM